jgi:hypothetical protein
MDQAAKLRDLFRDYGKRWEFEEGRAWVACSRHGTAIHVIAAHSLDDLRAKLEEAESGE